MIIAWIIVGLNSVPAPGSGLSLVPLNADDCGVDKTVNSSAALPHQTRWELWTIIDEKLNECHFNGLRGFHY